MSDQAVPPALPDEAHAPRPAGIYEHFGEKPGCGKWGGWGYARSKQQVEWFCYEHAPLERI
jgi:hypothetical protein